MVLPEKVSENQVGLSNCSRGDCSIDSVAKISTISMANQVLSTPPASPTSGPSKTLEPTHIVGPSSGRPLPPPNGSLLKLTPSNSGVSAGSSVERASPGNSESARSSSSSRTSITASTSEPFVSGDGNDMSFIGTQFADDATDRSMHDYTLRTFLNDPLFASNPEELSDIQEPEDLGEADGVDGDDEEMGDDCELEEGGEDTEGEEK